MPDETIRYDNQKIIDVEISTEIRKAFLDYSMSVIVSCSSGCKRWFKACSQKNSLCNV